MQRLKMKNKKIRQFFNKLVKNKYKLVQKMITN